MSKTLETRKYEKGNITIEATIALTTFSLFNSGSKATYDGITIHGRNNNESAIRNKMVYR